jgi:hypothetical protein
LQRYSRRRKKALHEAILNNISRDKSVQNVISSTSFFEQFGNGLIAVTKTVIILRRRDEKDTMWLLAVYAHHLVAVGA